MVCRDEESWPVDFAISRRVGDRMNEVMRLAIRALGIIVIVILLAVLGASLSLIASY
jgi:hypothetical protein